MLTAFSLRSPLRPGSGPGPASRCARAIGAGLLALIAALLAGGWGLGSAHAETRRVAVVVGHNTGGEGERPLRYAEDDAAKLADVLVELGDVERARLFLVRGKPREVVVDVLGKAGAAVKAARRAPNDRVILTFFYSGHSNASALQLGKSRRGYAELKRLLPATGAEVRLTIVDGCKSGGLVATKGGKPGPAFELGLSDQLSSAGEATLTSSAADEASLESSEIRGSFFTHHLVSGLRGAADASGDGRVTLSEAYEYAFNRTVVASASAGSAPQHPNYSYQLSGGGELVLTRVGERSASLRLPAGFSRALVINVLRDQVIAELTRDEARVLAVAPGEYAVRLWKAGAAFAGRVKARAHEATEVKWEQLTAATAAPAQGKGAEPWPAHQAGEDELSPEAQAIYDAQVLSVGDVLTVNAGDRSAQISTSKELYEGKYRRRIQPEVFLRRVGRSQQADRVKTRRHVRQGLVIGGGVILLGSLLYGLLGERCDPPLDDPDFGDCMDRQRTALITGGIGAFAGTAVIFSGTLLSDRVPAAHELRELADRHNRELRTRLRSPGHVQSTPITASLQLAPVVTPSGGGLALTGRF